MLSSKQHLRWMLQGQGHQKLVLGQGPAEHWVLIIMLGFPSPCKTSDANWCRGSCMECSFHWGGIPGDGCPRIDSVTNTVMGVFCAKEMRASLQLIIHTRLQCTHFHLLTMCCLTPTPGQVDTTKTENCRTWLFILAIDFHKKQHRPLFFALWLFPWFVVLRGLNSEVCFVLLSDTTLTWK